jgi:signal peptidase II
VESGDAEAGDQPAPRAAPASRGSVLVLAVALGVVLVDFVTKVWAVDALADGPVNIVGDTIELRLTRNSGSAFSLFQGFTPLLAVVAIVAAVVLFRVSRRTKDLWTVVALSMILGGAVGNLSDRVFRAPGFLHGAVVDFVVLGRWPTFNAADAAITIGAALLVVRGLRRETRYA